jgi:hypothetical protein
LNFVFITPYADQELLECSGLTGCQCHLCTKCSNSHTKKMADRNVYKIFGVFLDVRL